ncbi:membrane protein [Bacteroidia bacterium]|nr:membrane protein [Bacteroidia bacterium]
MSLPLFIARRYMRSKRSLSVINLISRVSMVAVAVPVAAMIILLSIFNGFEGMVRGMFTRFDPDIMVTAARGKVFDPDTLGCNVAAWPGVEAVSMFLDENALARYGDRQFIVSVRGADSLLGRVVPIEECIEQGDYRQWFGDMPQAIVGRGVAWNLGVSCHMPQPISLFVPRRGAIFSSLLPLESFRSGGVFPAGIFALDVETDSQWIIVPLEFWQQVSGYEGRASGLMIKTERDSDAAKVKESLRKELGANYVVRDRLEQKASLYRVMVYEKWGIFFIVLLVLVISSCAVVGALAMLILDKQDDIFTLSVFGANRTFIRRIFIDHAMMTAMAGAGAGLALGLLFCLLQSWLGLIAMPAQTFLTDSYPVEVHIVDIAVVAATVAVVDYIIIRFTASLMIKRQRCDK